MSVHTSLSGLQDEDECSLSPSRTTGLVLTLPCWDYRIRIGVHPFLPGLQDESGESAGRVWEECRESVGIVWGECGDSVRRVLGECWESMGRVWEVCGESVGRGWGENGAIVYIEI